METDDRWCCVRCCSLGTRDSAAVDTAMQMTLRACAARDCWRSFPVEVHSPRIYCDDECEAAAQAFALLQRLQSLPYISNDALVRVRFRERVRGGE